MCKCQICGADIEIDSYWFKKNKRIGRDGCKHVSRVKIGDTIGYLNVVDTAPDYIKPKSGRREIVWKCRCVCGRYKNVLQSNLKSLKTTSCGLCSNQISIPEKMIYYYLERCFDEVYENYRPPFLHGKEIDVYLPSIHVGIEYDGERWHQDNTADIEKARLCQKNGVQLIRVREPNCPSISANDVQCIITPKPQTNGAHMTAPIIEIINLLNENYGLSLECDVDCLRDNAEICRRIMVRYANASLAALYPHVAAEWDYERNAPLTPDRIPAHKGTKAWWICPKGHHYSAVIASRTGNPPSGCSICSGTVYKDGKYLGINSLGKTHPEIAEEFDSDKNGISADDIAAQSNRKVWWRCKVCGKEWQTKVNNRTSKNHEGCPVCGRNKQVKARISTMITKRGSLLELCPKLCMEWDYDKNDSKPSDYTKGSGKKVWWKCSNGHSFFAAINKRTGKKPTGCPECFKQHLRNNK